MPKGLKGFQKGNKIGLGRKHTKETRIKISNAHLGRALSMEHRKKLSLAKLGKISPKKGKPSGRKGIKWNHPYPLKGEKSPRWKGGISREYKTGYYSLAYKEWRMKVFVRDGFKCQECGIVGGYLTVHHIKSFAHYPELRFDINNGVTLCEECHKLTDNYKGKNKNKRK